MDLNEPSVSVIDSNRLEKHRDLPLLAALKDYSLQDIAALMFLAINADRE